MEENKRIDYSKVFKAIWAKRKLYWRVLPITVILALIYIMPQPRYYTCDVMLAPEGAEDVSGSSLSSLASSFGFNIGGATNDAIYPLLYPDLFESAEFVVSLLGIQVTFTDEDNDNSVVNTDYYTYLTKYEKKNWLTKPFVMAGRWLKESIAPMKDEDKRVGDVTKLNPFMLSAEDYKLVESISDRIQCSVDKKTDVATITVTDQDRVVCAMLADSIKARLQVYITDYRTNKARLDMNYYKTLADSAFADYKAAISKYSDYADAHQNTILQAYQSKRDELENDMQIKYETYTTVLKQYELAKAKVQERTPAFATLKSASAPIKPAGPKRMIFVISAFLLAFVGTTIYILRDILKS